MIKVLNQYFPRRWAVVLVGESLLILLALAAAVAWESGGWPPSAPPLGLALKVILITLICQICLHYSDLYEPNDRAGGGVVLTRLLQALGIASLVLALVYWLLPEARLSTGMVVDSVIALVLILLGWRRAVDWTMRWAHRAFPVGERLLVLGAGERAAELARELRLRPHLGLQLLGAIDESGELEARLACADNPGHHPRLLGGLDNLTDVIAAQRPQRIVIATQDRFQPLPMEALIAARAAGVRIEEAPNLFERITGRVAIESIQPSWRILTDGSHVSLAFRLYQRATSIVGAVCGLIVMSPVMLAIAIAIKLESPGPVIYRQTRVGLDGREFDILKFRSMRADAESSSGPVWAQAQDPRITRVGHWLRKLRLDEVPQLFNVLQGSMSIVGPRPERPTFVHEFRQAIPCYEMRHVVRPGITGWAQVSRDYGASVDDAREKLEYDLFYIKNLSIWMDLFILFQTTKIIFLGRGAR